MPTEEEPGQPAGVAVVRQFGWQDMFVPPDEDPRSQALSVGERATLTDYLHAYRQTLELKCQGLDAAGMASRSVPPSTMSLLGLVRHLADVERRWFRQVLAGEEAPLLFRTEQDREAAFDGALPDPVLVDEAWAAWRVEVAFAREFADAAPDLGITGTIAPGADIALREVLVHMIEEYARHCGHADLLRERIDGRVGQ
ncbi:MAG TPA: DinB family protein [Streptosporangiaceae bacterium]|jgi:hypothetical protein